MAEVLAKVVKQVSDAEAEAERRSGILAAIDDLQTMRAECAWLTEYDRDDSRYKVRNEWCAWETLNMIGVCRNTIAWKG